MIMVVVVRMMAVRIVSSYEELEKFNLFVNIGVMMVIMNVMIMVVVRMITVMIFSSYEEFEKVNTVCQHWCDDDNGGGGDDDDGGGGDDSLQILRVGEGQSL